MKKESDFPLFKGEYQGRKQPGPPAWDWLTHATDDVVQAMMEMRLERYSYGNIATLLNSTMPPMRPFRWTDQAVKKCIAEFRRKSPDDIKRALAASDQAEEKAAQAIIAAIRGEKHE